MHHYAFVYGKIGDGRNVPTRLHRANVVEDVFGGAQAIHAALGRFKKAGRGVLVYLRDGASGVPTTAIAEDITPSELERSREWREVGLGAQILRDLRISSIQLHATRSRTYVGLAGFGIEIESTEPLDEVASHRLPRETRQPRRAVDVKAAHREARNRHHRPDVPADQAHLKQVHGHRLGEARTIHLLRNIADRVRASPSMRCTAARRQIEALPRLRSSPAWHRG